MSPLQQMSLLLQPSADGFLEAQAECLSISSVWQHRARGVTLVLASVWLMAHKDGLFVPTVFGYHLHPFHLLKAKVASENIRKEDSKVPDPKCQNAGSTIMRLPAPLKHKCALQTQSRI